MIKKLAIVLISTTFLWSCDDFARFKQEKMECQTKMFGPIDLVFKKRKVGSEIKLGAPGFNQSLTITEQTRDRILGRGGPISATINFPEKRVSFTMKNKIETVVCRHHSFKM